MTLLTSRRTTVRPDFAAALLLVLGGGLAVIGFLLPWARSAAISASTTGWNYVTLVLGQGAGGSTAQRVAALGILGVAVVGGACVVLGLATLLPVTHQPLGAIALLLGVAMLGAMLWWTYQAQNSVQGGVSALLPMLSAGWWLTAPAGLVCAIGGIRALSRRD